MKIISHRGFWVDLNDKNSLFAFNESFKLGFGIETDIRDFDGKLVVSHDIPNEKNINFSSLIDLIKNENHLIALNIKSDGLSNLIHEAMFEYNINNWFVFDMSIPDLRSHLDVGNPVFIRISDVEKDEIWIDEVKGIWLDSFSKNWFDNDIILKYLNSGKKVCVVSPELHKREHMQLWSQLIDISKYDNLILCTDFPDKAKTFFNL
jgi:hypothetical protein